MDIELYDAVQRLRFEHPGVRAVVIVSNKERVFCAGANIAMLGQSSHEQKVNFCKFTNETRNTIEDASRHSGQTYFCVVEGTAAGGGYELALATEHIILVDDGSSAVSLPEIALLGVLPGTGGLTRLVDKRRVRRDRADFFCTLSEGIRGKRALEWNLVDVSVALDRGDGCARIHVAAPEAAPPREAAGIHAQGAAFWPLALARELDDVILQLRTNEPKLGTWILTTGGAADLVAAADDALMDNADDWLAREITLYIKRVLKRLDVTSRSLIALIEPGSCFAGTLLELALAADRSYMLDGTVEGSDRPPAMLRPGPP